MAENQVDETLASQIVSKAEDRVSVASNWQLVWWRFRKNKLALFSMALLDPFLHHRADSGFLCSTQDPEETEARIAFIPGTSAKLFRWIGASAVGAGGGGQAQSGNSAHGMAG